MGAKGKIIACILLLGCVFHSQYKAAPTWQDFEAIWASDASWEHKLKSVDLLARTIYSTYSNLQIGQLQKALNIAKHHASSEWIARIELSLGSIYSYIDIQDSAKLYLDWAMEKLQTQKDPYQIARAYKEKSWLETYIPDYDAALTHGYKALDLFEQLELAGEMAIMKSRIALILISTGQFEETLPLLREAESSLLVMDNPKALAYTYRRMAEYFMHIQDSSQTHWAYNRYIEEADKLEKRSYISSAYTQRGSFLRKQGNFEAAEGDFLQAKLENQDTDYELITLISKFELGSLYVETRQYEQAIRILSEALFRIQELSQIKGRVLSVDFEGIYKTLSAAYAGLGMFEEAYFYQSRYQSLKDSLYTIETNRSIAEMRTKYETEKKEALLDQKQQQLYATLGLLGLVGLMSVALWRAYAGKQKQNLLLKKNNEEKAFLIKEIHHRVKNNLQVLSSLLSLQSDYIADPNALDAVLEGRNRVQSMGLIHQKLYMGENLAAVEMEPYIRDLSDHLLNSFGVEERVEMQVRSEIPPLDVDTAIPLGLIINELVTNSLKYAFPQNEAGTIQIHLWINQQKELCLLLEDNGVGKEAIIPNGYSTSFGTDLVKILSKKLKGKIQVNQDSGYQTYIRFRRFNLAAL